MDRGADIELMPPQAKKGQKLSLNHDHERGLDRPLPPSQPSGGADPAHTQAWGLWPPEP